MKPLKNFEVMWRKKEAAQRSINQALQGYNLSSTAKDIYVFTAASHSTCITNIAAHNYFDDVSFSTIKRAVLELKNHNLLNSDNGDYLSSDKRVTWLTVNR
tara:strand:+ start:228 stop:530 length:303 start_codon:yes stop_codon:yes gene_type:complete